MIMMTKLAILASGAALAAMVANGAMEYEKYRGEEMRLAAHERLLRIQTSEDRAVFKDLSEDFHNAGVGAHNDIEVRVYKHVAYLSGFANTEQEKLEAIEVIKETPGIVAVNAKDLRHVVDLPGIVVKSDYRVDEGQMVAAR